MEPATFHGLEVGPWSEWAAAAASVASVVVVGWYTRRVAADGLKAQRTATENQALEERSSVIRAFMAEFEGVAGILSDPTVTARIKQVAGGGRRFGNFLPVVSKPVTAVYDTGAANLGKLPPSVSFAIVEFYMDLDAAFRRVQDVPPDGTSTLAGWGERCLSDLETLKEKANAHADFLRRLAGGFYED